MMTSFALIFVVCGTIWGAMALWFKSPAAGHLRLALPALWAMFALLAIIEALNGNLYFVGAFAVAWVCMLLWWVCLVRPSNDRAWMPEVLHQTSGSRVGDVVRLHNVRDFKWMSSEVFEPRWVTRDYDLSKLESVDLVLSYWGRPAIAHAMVSFGFGENEYVVFSVEIRRKIGDKFSELGGFFRQYELAVLASTEEDSLRVRTNVRGEDAYIYRVAMERGNATALFLAYVDTANGLLTAPRFYNTLTANCTTLVFQLANRIVRGLPMDHRLLLSGYLPEYLFSIDALSGADSVSEYRSKGRFTERAIASVTDGDFSRNIRRGVPGVDS